MKKKEQLEFDLCEGCPFITDGEGGQQGAKISSSLVLGGTSLKILIKKDSQEL